MFISLPYEPFFIATDTERRNHFKKSPFPITFCRTYSIKRKKKSIILPAKNKNNTKRRYYKLLIETQKLINICLKADVLKGTKIERDLAAS